MRFFLQQITECCKMQKKSHRVTPRSNLRFCYFCRVASCKKSWMGSTFCCNFQQSSQVAERVTPSLQLASLFSMCKFVASCKKNRIVYQYLKIHLSECYKMEISSLKRLFKAIIARLNTYA